MKNILFAMAICAIVFSSCRNNSSKKAETHTHDDGTVHTNHSHSEEDMPQQELFKVDIDSLSTGNDTTKHELEIEHSHQGGHTHKH